jgi:SAM-dependent methyltransferase
MKRNIRKEPCIISGTKNYVDYSEGLIRNTDSGLVVAAEIPDEVELKKLYEKEYFFGMEYSDYIADRPALEANFRQRVMKLKKMGFISKKKRIVEVGCAYGYFLNLVKDKSLSHEGFDVTPDGVKFAKKELGVNASNENFLTKKFKHKVDLVCMWDVIEHVGQPQEFVKKAASILEKGGALALTTGDIGTLVPRIRKGKWRMIHPPTHIYYFDKKTMTALLDMNGFDLLDYRYDAVYRNLGSVLNQLIVNQKAKGGNATLLRLILKACTGTGLTKLNIALNTFDIMDVVAVKR